MSIGRLSDEHFRPFLWSKQPLGVFKEALFVNTHFRVLCPLKVQARSPGHTRQLSGRLRLILDVFKEALFVNTHFRVLCPLKVQARSPGHTRQLSGRLRLILDVFKEALFVYTHFRVLCVHLRFKHALLDTFISYLGDYD